MNFLEAKLNEHEGLVERRFQLHVCLICYVYLKNQGKVELKF